MSETDSQRRERILAAFREAADKGFELKGYPIERIEAMDDSELIAFAAGVNEAFAVHRGETKLH